MAKDRARSREVRLGVVMFGGISLAVYINGVANELFRASRGRGVYRLLKALTDSEIVIDILSGASAGGINGILLSAALCNDTEFDTTGELWREHADIEPLLTRRPEANDPPLDNSVLNGAYHQAQMELAFCKLVNGPKLRPDDDTEDPSPVDELDLFITGTDIHGKQRQFKDALDDRIELENHRVVFQLKHRDHRKRPFSASALQNGEPHPDAKTCDFNYRALATLAHITSCFPGAFVPLRVAAPAKHAAPVQDFGTVDGRLSYWGELAEKKPRSVLLMDGGVLENQPFTSTIEAIFSRLADTQVSRYMLYVDPVPLRKQRAVQQAQGDDPNANIAHVAYAAASGLPRFESMDGDLRAVHDHNVQVQQYEALVRAATAAVMSLPYPPTNVEQTPANNAYQRARVTALSAGAAAALYDDQAPQKMDGAQLITALLAAPGLNLPLRALYDELDAWFAFRRLMHLTYLVSDTAAAPGQSLLFELPPLTPGGDWRLVPISRALVTTLNRQIELYEIVQSMIERGLSELPALDLNQPSAWQAIHERARQVLNALPMPACFAAGFVVTRLDQCVTGAELGKLRDAAIPALASPTQAQPASSFLEGARRFERTLLDAEPDLCAIYQRFEAIDQVAHPLELIARLRGRDQIHTVRVSPVDATSGFAAGFTHKLCGTQAADFGSFFKQSWRCNDLLWGRLDGTSQLLGILLDAERLSRLPQPLLLANLTAALGPQLSLEPLFPHSTAEARDALEGWLWVLASGARDAVEAALQDLKAKKREQWTRAVQLEILVEELPLVLKAACAETKGKAQQALQAQLATFDALSGSDKGTEVAKYFVQGSYTIPQQTLLGSIPRRRLLRQWRKASSHFIAAVLKSLPPACSLPEAALRAGVASALGAASAVGAGYIAVKAKSD